MNHNELLKKQLLDGYLKQQRGVSGAAPYAPSVASTSSDFRPSPQVPPSGGGGELVPFDETNIPENITLEEFKNYVKKWLEVDNMIKKVQEALKEKKKYRDKLSNVISQFMCKYNIEDLNTKEGRIRCKVSTVKTPVSKKVIQEKISDFFKNDSNKKDEFLTTVFEDRPVKEKVSLRRLKIS